jgi:exodeoxyribonuclease-5
MSEALAPTNTLELSEDQADAMEAIVRALAIDGQQIATLVGPAGSGKSTVVQKIATYIPDTASTMAAPPGSPPRYFVPLYTAPTGKAALRLGQLANARATTLHSLLYGGADTVIGPDNKARPVFTRKRYAIGAHNIVVVDEASMVNGHLHSEIMAQMPAGAKLLYVGDKEQLPPVDGEWGAGLDTPTAELTKIHRQAEGNPIIRVATSIREGGGFGQSEGAVTLGRASMDDVIDWLIEGAQGKLDRVAVTWTNQIKGGLNHGVRRRLGHEELIVPGDRLRIARNQHQLGWLNGEIVEVLGLVRPGQDADVWRIEFRDVLTGRLGNANVRADLIGLNQGEFAARVQKEHGRSEREKLLHVDYGYALTVHSSQGSQWKDVGFVLDDKLRWKKGDDPEFARRLAYTAVTRAQERLWVFDLK